MQIDKKKLERQLIGVNKWFNSSEYGASKNMQGCLHYFTGVGKTYTAILITKRLLRIDSKKSIVIIVPNQELLKQWQTILNNTFLKKELSVINIFTSNYILSNNLRISTNTLIVDELHSYYSEKHVKVINGDYIKFDNNLALTATYKDSKNREKLIKDIYPIIDEIDETTAIAEGYISPFVEFNLALELSDADKILYNKYSDIIKNNINKFGNNGLTLATKCLSGGKHKDGKYYKAAHYVYGWAHHKGWRKDLDLNNPQSAQIDDIWNPHKIFGYAVTLITTIKKRKDILYNNQVKLNACFNILTKFTNLKSIVFSQSTNFADKLNLTLNNSNLNSVVYHSQLLTELRPSLKTGKLTKFGKTRLKKEAIESIKSGKANILVTATSLDKGLDVPDITLGLTASGISNFTQYKQRGGRTKRLNLFNDNKVALLINLYFKDTKDETWLRKRQSQSNHTIYWIDNIDNINFNFNDNITDEMI